MIRKVGRSIALKGLGYGMSCLLSTLWNYQDIKQLAMHRFKSAELLDENSVLLEGFNY